MERYLREEIPKLGFGLMRLPMVGEEVDIRGVRSRWWMLLWKKAFAILIQPMAI